MSRKVTQMGRARAFLRMSGAIAAAAGLLIAGSLLTLSSSAAGPKHKDSRRAFYLSQNGVPADQALTACVPGFHMASLYEILDPSSLRYDASLGLSFEDTGAGPTRGPGWIRTGTIGWSTAISVPGDANCNAWQSTSPDINGSTVGLGTWDHAATSISPWSALVVACHSIVRVWCVQD